MAQHIETSISCFDSMITKVGAKRFFLVCDSSFEFLPASVQDIYRNHKDCCTTFSDFTPNPLYDDVKKGVELFNRERCDAVIAIGGGSTIDVAKCVKLFCRMNDSVSYLDQEKSDTGIPIIAIPTTAGTGSESTRHAVIYDHGIKQSVSHESIVPDYVILEPSVLKTLPLYQKKCTLLDALCQAIESWWSVNSTQESVAYSKKAIRLIVENMDAYLNCFTDDAAERIMLGANYAGRAINITATTAAHAMSYKLTSMYRLPHGHAVAICLPQVWSYMYDHPENCIDKRGREHLLCSMNEIAFELKCADVKAAIGWFEKTLKRMQINFPEGAEADLQVLAGSVNSVRLKNNPVELDTETLIRLYKKIVRVQK